MKALLAPGSFLLLALGALAVPVHAATINLNDAPYTIENDLDVYRVDGFKITSFPYNSPRYPGEQHTWNLLSDTYAGYESNSSKIRVEREDGRAFTMSGIGIDAVYSGVGVIYEKVSDDEIFSEFFRATWDALLLTTSTSGVIGQTRVSPWMPFQVNLDGIDWIEMTITLLPDQDIYCDPANISNITSPTLAADAQLFCAGMSVPGFNAGIDYTGFRNDLANARIASIDVTPVPLPAGIWLLGSALLVFFRYGVRSRRPSSVA